MDEEKSTPPQQKQHKGFLEELMEDVFNLDRGLPGTIWGMLKKPEEVIDAYFTDRGKYVTPLRYCIFILAVTTFISVRFIDYDAMMTNAMEMGAGESLEDLLAQLNQMIPSFDWEAYFQNINEITVSLVQKFNQALYLVLLAPIFALFTRMFFKKKKSRFVEHYVLMVYSLTSFSIFSIFMLPVMKMMESAETPLIFFMGIPLMLGFLMYATVRYLGLKGFSEYLQTVIALVLGYILYSIVQTLFIYLGAYLMVIF
ncbi:MAG: hypothetical protein CL662_09675 [Bacteroidetes bacterium]|jgi:hypothetical protein|nr:hypothetical protein [Bacteroidota bacterium]|tara:strand:- start:603 stop:1370 length:768 start_codon:yes stop_codon:yes gene_type:complete